MNDNQKERLLKLAETNPELAKEMLDIFKDEKSASQEPIAVKVVKAEEDKLTFTEEQKKWAIACASIPISLFVIDFFTMLLFGDEILYAGYLPFAVQFFIVSVVVAIVLAWFCAYKAGMPTIKQFMSKHIKPVHPINFH